MFLAPEVQDLGRDLQVDGPQAKQETWALLASAKNTVNFAKADWTTEFVNLVRRTRDAAKGAAPRKRRCSS